MYPAVTSPETVSGGRLGCPLCLQLSAVVEGMAGDDAVTVKCEREECGIPFILPAVPAVIERIAAMYGKKVPAAYLAGLAPAEGCMADGPGLGGLPAAA